MSRPPKSSGGIVRSLWKPKGPDKAFLEWASQHKFHAPEHELDAEKFLDHITPRDKVKKQQMKAYIDTQVYALQNRAAGIMSEGSVKGAVLLEDIRAQVTAWRWYGVSLDAPDSESTTDANFTKHFYAWLKGCGTEEDHEKTPWYRQMVRDKECRAFLDSFVDAKFDFLRKITAICVKANVTNLQGIGEYYLYFKYIVRGGWESRDDAEFLYDYNKIMCCDSGTKKDQGRGGILGQPPPFNSWAEIMDHHELNGLNDMLTPDNHKKDCGQVLTRRDDDRDASRKALTQLQVQEDNLEDAYQATVNNLPQGPPPQQQPVPAFQQQGPVGDAQVQGAAVADANAAPVASAPDVSSSESEDIDMNALFSGSDYVGFRASSASEEEGKKVSKKARRVDDALSRLNKEHKMTVEQWEKVHIAGLSELEKEKAKSQMRADYGRNLTSFREKIEKYAPEGLTAEQNARLITVTNKSAQKLNDIFAQNNKGVDKADIPAFMDTERKDMESTIKKMGSPELGRAASESMATAIAESSEDTSLKRAITNINNNIQVLADEVKHVRASLPGRITNNPSQGEQSSLLGMKEVMENMQVTLAQVAESTTGGVHMMGTEYTSIPDMLADLYIGLKQHIDADGPDSLSEGDKNTLQILQNQLIQAKATATRVSDELSHSTREVESLKQKLVQAGEISKKTSEGSYAQIDEYQEKLRQLESDLRLERAQYAITNADRLGSKDAERAAMLKAEALEGEIEGLKKSHTASQSQMKNDAVSIMKLQTALEAAQEQNESLLQTGYKAYSDKTLQDMQQYIDQINTQDATIEQLKMNVQSLTEVMEKGKGERLEEQKQHDRILSDMQEELGIRGSRTEELSDALRAEKIETNTLEKAVERQTAEKAALRSKVKELEEQISSITAGMRESTPDGKVRLDLPGASQDQPVDLTLQDDFNAAVNEIESQYDEAVVASQSETREHKLREFVVILEATKLELAAAAAKLSSDKELVTRLAREEHWHDKVRDAIRHRTGANEDFAGDSVIRRAQAYEKAALEQMERLVTREIENKDLFLQHLEKKGMNYNTFLAELIETATESFKQQHTLDVNKREEEVKAEETRKYEESKAKKTQEAAFRAQEEKHRREIEAEEARLAAEDNARAAADLKRKAEAANKGKSKYEKSNQSEWTTGSAPANQLPKKQESPFMGFGRGGPKIPGQSAFNRNGMPGAQFTPGYVSELNKRKAEAERIRLAEEAAKKKAVEEYEMRYSNRGQSPFAFQRQGAQSPHKSQPEWKPQPKSPQGGSFWDRWAWNKARSTSPDDEASPSAPQPRPRPSPSSSRYPEPPSYPEEDKTLHLFERWAGYVNYKGADLDDETRHFFNQLQHDHPFVEESEKQAAARIPVETWEEEQTRLTKERDIRRKQDEENRKRDAELAEFKRKNEIKTNSKAGKLEKAREEEATKEANKKAKKERADEVERNRLLAEALGTKTAPVPKQATPLKLESLKEVGEFVDTRARRLYQLGTGREKGGSLTADELDTGAEYYKSAIYRLASIIQNSTTEMQRSSAIQNAKKGGDKDRLSDAGVAVAEQVAEWYTRNGKKVLLF